MITLSEKIRLIARRKGITITELADATGQTRQNLTNKLRRDNLTVEQIQHIAAALGCTVDTIFTDTETGETL